MASQASGGKHSITGDDCLRWSRRKDTVESALNLDILDLQKKGFLALEAGFSSQIQWISNGKQCSIVGYELKRSDGVPVSMRLQYTTSNANPRACDYWISITGTACNYGGIRLWFICPGWKRRRLLRTDRAPDEDPRQSSCSSETFPPIAEAESDASKEGMIGVGIEDRLLACARRGRNPGTDHGLEDGPRLLGPTRTIMTLRRMLANASFRSSESEVTHGTV